MFVMGKNGLKGTTPMTDGDGKLIATLKFSTNNIAGGELSAQVVLPDGSIFAQIERPSRAQITSMWNERMTVTVNGAPYATVDSGQNGKLQRADGSGGITYDKLASCTSAATCCCVYDWRRDVW